MITITNRHVANGLFWSAITQGVNLIRVAFTFMLAWLVDPSDFGLVAFGMSIIGFAQMFRDIGVHQAIIQKKEVSDIEASSVFWLTVIIGIGLTSIVCLTSQTFTTSYKDSSLNLVIIILSFDILLRTIYQVPDALIRRSLNFKIFAVADFYGNLCSGIIALLLAYYGFGWIALVLRVLFSSLIVLVIIFISSRWMPTFSFSLALVKPFFCFGAPVFGAGFLNYVKNQSDIVLIGAFASFEELGYYQLALSVAGILGGQLGYSIGRVYYPVLSRLHGNDPSKFIKGAMRYMSLTLSVLFIAAFYFSIGGADLLPIVLGDKWSSTKILLPILAWGAFFQGAAICSSIILRSSGNPTIELWGTIPGVLVAPVMIYFGLQIEGVYGAALAYTATSILSATVMIFLQSRTLVGFGFYMDVVKDLLIVSLISLTLIYLSKTICDFYDINSRLIIDSMAILVIFVLIYFMYSRKSLV